jgi:hypothetical protein
MGKYCISIGCNNKYTGFMLAGSSVITCPGVPLLSKLVVQTNPAAVWRGASAVELVGVLDLADLLLARLEGKVVLFR